MTTKLEYQTIDLKAPTRVFQGRPKTTGVEAVNGVTITRVLDSGLDFFAVAGPNVLPGVEVPIGNVAAMVRKPGPALKGTK